MPKGRGRVPVAVPGVVAAVTMAALLGGIPVVAVGNSVGPGVPCRQMVLPFSNATYAIEMVKTENVAQVVAQVGGPPEYIRENWDRLVGTAQHLAELRGASA